VKASPRLSCLKYPLHRPHLEQAASGMRLVSSVDSGTGASEGWAGSPLSFLTPPPAAYGTKKRKIVFFNVPLNYILQLSLGHPNPVVKIDEPYSTVGCSDFSNSIIRIVEKVQNKILGPVLKKVFFSILHHSF